MIMDWLKKHSSVLIIGLTCVAFALYCYGCESKVRSLTDRNHFVNRQELQLELDQFISLAQFRVADLDQQDAFRSIFLQNALILVQGQPLNPVGILTLLAGIYGIQQGASNATKVIKTAKAKRKVNNA